MIAGAVAFISMDFPYHQVCYVVRGDGPKHGSVKRVVNSVFGVGDR